MKNINQVNKITSLNLPLEFWEYKYLCNKINLLKKEAGTRFSAQQRISNFIIKDLEEVKKILKTLEDEK